jgi:predicted DNA binding protein
LLEAVLSVEGLHCWASDTAIDLSTTINVLDYRRNGRGHVVHNWVEVLTDDKDANAMTRAFSRHNDVLDARISKLKTGMLGVVKTRKCPASSIMEGLKCIVKQHEVNADGSSRLTVIAADSGTLKKVIERMEKMGYVVKVLMTSSRIESVLTVKQKRIVKLAFEHGYFDFPRQIRQRDLAKLSGISSSSLSEILRRAEKSAVKAYLTHSSNWSNLRNRRE